MILIGSVYIYIGILLYKAIRKNKLIRISIKYIFFSFSYCCCCKINMYFIFFLFINEHEKNILFIYHQTKYGQNSHVNHKDDRQSIDHYVYPNLKINKIVNYFEKKKRKIN